MQKTSFDGKRINNILEKTLKAIEAGKEEIFDIAENSREECESIKNDLNNLQNNVASVIKEVDKLEIEEKRTRNKLMVVSKNFHRYSEEDIRLAYEDANNIRVDLILKRQMEKSLIERRKELEMRLKNALQIVQKAEKLITQVGVAMEYLSGSLNNIIDTLEDMSKRQFLGIRVIEAQEEERQRVAREIHDGPAQSMANVVLKAEICEKLLSLDMGKAKEELKNLKGIVRSSLKDVRKIIYDLRPMSLDDLGLIPTIQRYGYNFTEETNIQVEVQVYGKQKSIDSIVQIASFRIIQEALNNVKKHSRANNVIIKIEMADNSINIIIRDNGIGFNIDNQRGAVKESDSGYGIIGMRERAELLGGKLEIRASLGQGTKIALMIPINGKGDIYER